MLSVLGEVEVGREQEGSRKVGGRTLKERGRRDTHSNSRTAVEPKKMLERDEGRRRQLPSLYLRRIETSRVVHYEK